MTRTVTLEEPEVTLSNVDLTKGYAFMGTKGLYVLVRNTEGNFSFASLGKTTKPVKVYDDEKAAIKDKIEAGYDVFEFTSVELD